MDMKDFAAIDFETANNERTSVCSVGIVIYREGKKWMSFTHLSNLSPIITHIGQPEYMDLHEQIPMRHPCFLRYEHK